MFLFILLLNNLYCKYEINLDYIKKSQELHINLMVDLKKTKLDYKYLYIVLPEYLSYDINQNKIEIMLIKLLHNMNLNAAKTISVGPFQMTPDFIYNSVMANKSHKEDIDFIMIRKNGINFLINNIEEFDDINFQLSVLDSFVENYKYNGMSFKSNLIKYLYLYNTGKVFSKKSNISNPIFDKLEGYSMSYVNWGIYLYDNNYLEY